MVFLLANNRLSNRQQWLTMLTLYMCLFHLSGSSFSKTVPLVAAANNNGTAQGKEAVALIKWKHSLDNQSLPLLSSWIIGGNPCNNWVGVACDESTSVKHLNLSRFGLRSTLQNLNFSSLTNLISIDLAEKDLYGNIPLGLYKLSKLTHLDLAGNCLSGILSPRVANLSSLLYLHLARNQLSGTIPTEIGLVIGLYELLIAANHFNGLHTSRYRNVEVFDKA